MPRLNLYHHWLRLQQLAESDGTLQERYRRIGDEQAFAGLMHRYGSLVWRVCYRALPNRTDAEDAFQATFLALAQSIKRNRVAEHLPGWLHSVALRVCSKLKRSHTRK